MAFPDIDTPMESLVTQVISLIPWLQEILELLCEPQLLFTLLDTLHIPFSFDFPRLLGVLITWIFSAEM